MRPVFRNLIFTGFATTFLIGAPLLVLYTAGYRYNTVNGHVVRTGVLTVSSIPRGTTVSIPGYSSDKKTPVIFNRIMPGNYALTLHHEAYHDWQATVTVASGRTTGLGEIILFHDLAPTLTAVADLTDTVPSPDGTMLVGLLRTDSAAAVWRVNVEEKTSMMIAEYPAQVSDALQLEWGDKNSIITLTNITTNNNNTFDINSSIVKTKEENNGPLKLVINNQAVELHDARHAEQPLIGFLPLADYTVAEVNNNQVILTGSNQALYLIDVSAKNPILLATSGITYDFVAAHGLFAWSDGLELHTFDLASQRQTFITRQSKTIISVAWHDSLQALIVSTNNDVKAFSLNEQKTVTPLLIEATVFSFWLNEARDTGYFYGEYEGVRGVFTLPVTK